MQSVTLLYGHSLNTDTLFNIIEAFLCPWGESPYIFSNLNPLADTPVNPDNGRLFLAPINLTNANTSL